MSDWNTGVALDPVFLQHALLHKFRRAIPKATQNAARPNRARPADIHGSGDRIRYRRRGADDHAGYGGDAGLRIRHSGRLHPVRPDADRRRDLPSQDASGRLSGLAAIVIYKLLFTGFKTGAGLGGLALHMQHEAVILANLFLLLMGFAILSRHFENSHIPDEMPRFLPDGWQGGLALLPSFSCCRASSTTSPQR